MLPVVAIVGRPNVGKSTLFNRLTKTNAALMSSYAGMTRDRQYGEAKIEDKRFIVIDTGGIVEDQDEIEALTSQQVLKAINEADKIIFLIDGQAGITPEDSKIAAKLRKCGKKILLVVNKTESLDPNIVLAEGFELGMGTPIPISAAHGRGLSELIPALFPEQDTQTDAEVTEEHPGIKLAIVGRPNVGKSTLTNRILGEDRVIVHDSPGTTRDSIFIPLTRLDRQYTLIDTAGVRKRGKRLDTQERFSVVKTLQAIEASNVVLYIIDGGLGVSDQDLKLLGFIVESGKALVLAINKWDGLDSLTREHARDTIDRRLDFVNFARVHYISALHGSGVGTLFTSVDEAYQSAIKPLPTPLLSDLLQKAALTHSPPLVHGRRVKLRYAHLGGHNPPRIIIHGNQLQELPDSYKKFLAHFFRKRLQLYGTPVFIIFKTSTNPFAD